MTSPDTPDSARSDAGSAGPGKPDPARSEQSAPETGYPAAARPSRWWLVVCVLAVVLGLSTIFLSAAALYLAL